MLDIDTFKEAMATFPSGVVVATTVDQAGVQRGFTASSFTSLSLQPPLILLCLAKSAECHDAFCATEYFAVSVLGCEHEQMAKRFASRGSNKFHPQYDFIVERNGLPVVAGAASVLICRRFGTHTGGDHTILVGEVESASVAANSAPMLYFRRKLRSIGDAAPAGS